MPCRTKTIDIMQQKFTYPDYALSFCNWCVPVLSPEHFSLFQKQHFIAN